MKQAEMRGSSGKGLEEAFGEQSSVVPAFPRKSRERGFRGLLGERGGGSEMWWTAACQVWRAGAGPIHASEVELGE